MNSARFVLTSVLIVLSHTLISAAHPQKYMDGNSDGNSTASSSANSYSGYSDTYGHPNYSYSGVTSNGEPYGGYKGNGSYQVNITDYKGTNHTYSGGQRVQNNIDSTPTYTSTHTTSMNSFGQHSSSSSAYASAWSTFYIICFFSLFFIIKF